MSEMIVVPGSIWRHYKGEIYIVISTDVRRESDGGPLAIYRRHGDEIEGPYWARPVAEWGQYVGGRPRFERVDPDGSIWRRGESS